MSGVPNVAPEYFSGVAEDWDRWIARFARYLIVSKVENETDRVKINNLLFFMGSRGEEILEAVQLSDSEAESYDEVLKKFNNFFRPKVNVVYERARFNQRKQEHGESASDYIASLHVLTSNCEFGPFRDQLIRDRIVLGMLDPNLSLALQMDDKLTLESATAKVVQAEQVLGQQKVARMEHQGTTASISVIRKKSKNQKSGSSSGNVAMRHISVQTGCPAKHSKCNLCSRVGHYARCCRKGKPGQQSNAAVRSKNLETSVRGMFIGSVQSKSTPWLAKVQVGNSGELTFTIDSGADVTCIPEDCYTPSMGKLEKVDIPVLSAAGEPLKVIGKTKVLLSYDNQTTNSVVFVIRGLHRSLLGRPELESLCVIRRVHAVQCGDNGDPWKGKYPTLFSGLGTLPGEYSIQVSPNAEPFSVSVPRRVPIPLLPAVEKQIKSMVDDGIIEPVTRPTAWCAPMVVVPKRDGSVRITTDFSHLNQAVQRERFELPSVDDTVAQLGRARFFTKLDANSGFFQCPLDAASAPLTTFITPFGRYQYRRLPMGITSAPEIFSRKMCEILEGLDGVKNIMDDFCVFGETQKQHDRRLHKVLQRLVQSGITLNPDKCVFSVRSLKFIGFLIDENGVQPDPDKTMAICRFPAPKNVSEVRQWLGMVNQMARFVPNLSELTHPLRALLSKQSAWFWGPEQESSFQRLKELLVSPTVLAHYDPSSPTRVCADSSSHGLGAVLLQQVSGTWRPVAYASRSLIPAETRYAVIEKEALAITWACERFSQYLVGLKCEILTDHKPLISLLQFKRVDELPVRVQRFRLRLMRYSYDMLYIPGKEQATADALSRAPIKIPRTVQDLELESITDDYAIGSIQALPGTDARLEEIRLNQAADPILCKVAQYCREGWPDRVPQTYMQYYSVRSELSVVDGLLLKGSRLVIPPSLRKDIMDHIHQGHQGIVKCQSRARSAVWWPNMTNHISDRVARCETCCRERVNRSEPLISGEFPERPWQKVGTDLFHFQGKQYLIVVDYYSRYIEMALLSSTQSVSVITNLQSIFARHGVPVTVHSDGGPQYSSKLFREFAKEYGFEHVTSSPYFAQSNGEAERAVGTLKQLLRKASAAGEDPYLSLLSYRNTPIANGYSPSQLLMGRVLRSPLPMLPNNLSPKLPDLKVVRRKEKIYRDSMKSYADKHRGARPLPVLTGEDRVHLKREHKDYEVVRPHPAPRSYMLLGKDGEVCRRNRKDLVVLPRETSVVKDETECSSQTAPPTSPVLRRSQRATK
ncbi:hypothetical protein SNEBB_010510, partial [Seison nebaliae]